MLTTEQFIQTRGTLYWIKPKPERDREAKIALYIKWIEARCGAGFCYFDPIEQTFYFGSEGDRLMFRMWLADDPTPEDWEHEL